MVDCGNPRCAQERRSFRRDLQSWSKKLPLVLGMCEFYVDIIFHGIEKVRGDVEYSMDRKTVEHLKKIKNNSIQDIFFFHDQLLLCDYSGLERIAADYVDNDTAKLLLNPYPAFEQELIQDFEAPRKCFHCDKRLPNIYKRVQRIINDAKKGKETNGKICLRSLQDLMPFCVDFYTGSFGQELFSDAVKTYFLTSSQQPEVQEDSEPHIPVSVVNDTPAKLIVPHLTVSRPSKKRDVGRQAYTEKDLDCAVSDIQSGRLGTRRAAMIYGIPRSTLRNKIVKPERGEKIIPKDENQRPCLADLDIHKSASAPHQSNFKMSEVGIFGLNKPDRNRGSVSCMPACTYPISIKLEANDHELFLEHRLRQIRRMHNLNGLSEVQPRPAHVHHLKLPLLIDVVRKLVHERFMEVKHDHGWKNSFEINSEQDTKLFSPFNAYFPTLSSYHAINHSDENHSAPLYRHFMGSLYKSKEEFPLTSRPFGKVNESSRIGDTLKDIIAKTISEKIRFRNGSSDEGSPPSTPETHRILLGKSRDDKLFSLDSEVPSYASKKLKPSHDCCSPPKRLRKDDCRSDYNSYISVTSSSSSSAKKTRPKRGQYRRYNSQLLMDAVKAVQRGEMSVHRAGSYFGVPHSTLEYKVKERHLMRQKKAKDNQSPCSSSKSSVVLTVAQTTDRDSSLTPEDDVLFTSKKLNDSSSTRSSISSSSPPAIFCHPQTSSACTSQSLPLSSSSSPLPSSALSLPPSKDLNNLVWFQPYLTTVSQHIDPSIRLLPPSLSLNNSASELLRQLQYKVQAKSSSFPDDCAFELPCTKEHVFDYTQTSSIGTPLSDRLALYNESV